MNRSIILLLAVTAFGLVPYAANAAQFGIVNTYWGTGNTAISPMPGQYGVPFTVVMQNWQCGQIKNVTLTLSTRSTNFTTMNGQGSIAESVSSVGSNQQFQFTFYLNVPAGISPGAYSLPAQITWESTTNTYDNCTSTPSAFYTLSTPYYFTIPVYMKGNPVLGYTASSKNLTSGKVNNVTLYVSNNGFGNAMQVQLSVSPTSQSVGILTHPGIIKTLAAGSTDAINLSIYIPSNYTSSLLSLNLSSSFLNGSTGFQHQSNLFTFLVSTGTPLAVNENVSTVYVGYTSPLVIGITNRGNAAIRSVQATLSMSKMNQSTSGQVAITGGNPSYYQIVNPGQTILFTPYITAGPSTSEGGYSGTLAVSYQDANGAQQTVYYPIGFAIASKVLVTVQGVSAAAPSANSPFITASGSLIDQGAGNAYYATVYAYLIRNGTRIAGNSTYIGEVLSDSPTPFAVSIEMPATQGGAFSGNASFRRPGNSISGNVPSTSGLGDSLQGLKVGIYVAYQNDLGGQFNTNVSLYSVGGQSPYANALSGFTYYHTKKSGGIPYYVYVIGIVAVAGAGFFLYKRHSGTKKKRSKERQVV